MFFENIFNGRKSKVKVSYRRGKTSSSTVFGGSTKTQASDSIAPEKKESISQEEIDRILDKIADKGYDGLSKEEKRKLFEFSKK